MKYAVLLALLGVTSCVQVPDSQLVRINTSAFADSKSVTEPEQESEEDEDEGESSSEDEDEGQNGDGALVQLDGQLVAAPAAGAKGAAAAAPAAAAAAPCVYLDETQEEMEYQVEMFSRTLDVRHWKNANAIAGVLGKKNAGAAGMKIKTWELYDKAFSFPRVRRYGFTNDNMDLLEHFQDNVNLNSSNQVNFDNFVRTAKQVQSNLNTKFHNGEFNDPANTDPKAKK